MYDVAYAHDLPPIIRKRLQLDDPACLAWTEQVDGPPGRADAAGEGVVMVVPHSHRPEEKPGVLPLQGLAAGR